MFHINTKIVPLMSIVLHLANYFVTANVFDVAILDF